MEKLISFALGFLLARWLLLSSSREEYIKKEAEFIDRVQNRMHDLLKQTTDMNDNQIADSVLKITEDAG